MRAGWRSGAGSVTGLARMEDADVVVNAVVGAAGLAATLAALESGKRCALANKESLVAAGEIVLAAARSGGGALVPVDSEHSAILQCIAGAEPDEVRRIILTASGGPFRNTPAAEMAGITAADALRHPTWTMGAKISIDSATLANKALEVIEAHFLYGLGYDRIDAVVHPHLDHPLLRRVRGWERCSRSSASPTMELPILLRAQLAPSGCRTRALLHVRSRCRSSPLDVRAEIDHETASRCSRLGDRGRTSGADAAPAVYNAANEVAVAAFLEGCESDSPQIAVVGRGRRWTRIGGFRRSNDHRTT